MFCSFENEDKHRCPIKGCAIIDQEANPSKIVVQLDLLKLIPNWTVLNKIKEYLLLTNRHCV